MLKNKDGKLSIQSVERAIRILDLFDKKNSSLGVSEIARFLNLNKSTVWGIVSTLEEGGLLDQDSQTNKYALGLKLLQMANNVVGAQDIRKVAKSILQDMVNKYHETAHVVVHNKGEVIYIDKIEAIRSIGIVSKIGNRLPMYCTGVGKAILANIDEEYLCKHVFNKERRQFTKNTIVDESAFRKELSLIQAKGYALDNEEFELGLVCVAAAIKNYSGEVVGAISLSGPTSRMDSTVIHSMAQSIQKAAATISQNL